MRARMSTRHLRLLTEVADGKVQRTWFGWSVAGAPSTTAESRILRHFRDHGLVTPASSRALHEAESEPVTITDAGLADIATSWPEWRPQSPVLESSSSEDADVDAATKQ